MAKKKKLEKYIPPIEGRVIENDFPELRVVPRHSDDIEVAKIMTKYLNYVYSRQHPDLKVKK